MPDENFPVEEPQLPALKIIKQIKDGTIDPKTLPKEMRQAVVECMLSQFTPIPKIAAFLDKDERTIQRDKKEIAQRNSQKPSIDYSLELISELMQKAATTQSQLMELSRDEDGSVQEKAQAAFFLWKAVQEQMMLLQRLGYLPEQPLKIEANITQDTGRDVTKLKEELAEAERSSSQSGRANDPIVTGLIAAIKRDIAIAEANTNLDELKKLLSEPKKDEGNPNGASGQ